MGRLGVSAIIPTYNRCHLIGRAICCALHDLEPGDEIVVVDDGSTDGTEEVVRGIADKRVRYVHQANAGAGAARNRGALEARHDLLAYLDSDDQWIPGKTALQRRFFETRDDILFCFTNFAREYGGMRYGRDIARWSADDRGWDDIMGPPTLYSAAAELPPQAPDFPVYVGDIYRSEMHTNYILTSCLMVRARVREAARFSTTVRTYEDWAYFGQLARLGVGVFLDHESAVQYGHPGPRLTDADELTRIECRLSILHDVWGSDPDFLGKHGGEYRALVRELLLLKTRRLLGLGRRAEALATMRVVPGPPASYRIMASLPPPVLRFLAASKQFATSA